MVLISLLYKDDETKSPAPGTRRSQPKTVILDLQSKDQRNEVPVFQLVPLPEPKPIEKLEKIPFNWLAVMDRSKSMAEYIHMADGVAGGISGQISNKYADHTIVRDNLAVENYDAVTDSFIKNLKGAENDADNGRAYFRDLIKRTDVKNTVITLFTDGDPGGEGALSPGSVDGIVRWAAENHNRICVFFIHDDTQDRKEQNQLAVTIANWEDMRTDAIKEMKKSRLNYVERTVTWLDDLGHRTRLKNTHVTLEQFDRGIKYYKECQQNVVVRQSTLQSLCARSGGEFVDVGDEELKRIQTLSKSPGKKAELVAEQKKLEDRMVDILVKFAGKTQNAANPQAQK